MNGFLNINKPEGITSYDVIRRLKPLLPGVRMGHMGTLDPIASGVLPVALGHATRLLEYVTDQRKAYEATMVLGGISTTMDLTGEIHWTGSGDFDPAQIKEVLARFCGRIEQIPPMFSAVRHKGVRLYELARRGSEVERQPRQVEIYRLDLQEIDRVDGHQRLKISVECSSGTYIRSLCHDIGAALGSGAFMASLVRTRSGPFVLDDAVDLDTLLEYRDRLREYLKPPQFPLAGMPAIDLDKTQYIDVLHGRPLKGLEVVRNTAYLLYYQEEIIAVGRGKQVGGGVILQPEKVLTTVQGEQR